MCLSDIASRVREHNDGGWRAGLCGRGSCGVQRRGTRSPRISRMRTRISRMWRSELMAFGKGRDLGKLRKIRVIRV
ncbi:hypothetical protein [Azospirillum palustre]